MGTQEHPTGVRGQPAIGNVLGFSLLLRERKAMLYLERRALAPGVRLVGYEAEVPNVQFPMRARGAAMFRRRRCRVRRLGLELEARALENWLRARLCDHTLAGLRIDEVGLALAATVEPDQSPVPCLFLDGRREGRRGWVMVALEVLPQGRALALRPWRIWRLDDGAPEATALWRALATRLGGVPQSDATDQFVFDPIRRALLTTFVGAGWRVPDLSGLALDDLTLTPERAELSLVRRAEGAPAPSLPTPGPALPDPVSEPLTRIQQAIAEGHRAAAVTELEQLVEQMVARLPREHPARLAALRWLVRLAGREQPERALRAIRDWLNLRPRDHEAAHALTLALARSDDASGLAQRLAAEGRLPHAPLRQARLEVALACVRVDRLGDLRGGQELLEPLLARCTAIPSLAPVRLSAATCLARARAKQSPEEALHELNDALTLTDDPMAQASAQAAVATALARYGHHEAALPLWANAIEVAPDDEELVESALASARAAERPEQEVQWLRAGLPHASPPRTTTWRRALVNALLLRGDAISRELARVELRTLVHEQPHTQELARQLADLEYEDGHPERAAELLGRIIDNTGDPEPRTRLRIEQARRLLEAELPEQAWASLEPALAEAPAACEAELLALAIDLAPAPDRERLLDRLAQLDDDPRSGRALLLRARSRRSPAQRHEDLEAAASRLTDPRPALTELAELADADDPQPWQRLAEACRAHDDPVGEGWARVELGLRLLHGGQLDEARQALARAHELRPEDDGLALARGLVEARAERFAEAAELLTPVLHGDLALDRSPLDDPRLGLPDTLVQVRGQVGLVMLRADRPAEAATQLRPAVAELPADEDPSLAVALVEALEATAEDREAAAVARKVADGRQGRERAKWLVRAARLDESYDAVDWLIEASSLCPEDVNLLLEAEEAARVAGGRTRLMTILRRIAGHEDAPKGERARVIRELLQRLGPGPVEDPDRLELAEQLLTVDPDDVEAMLLLGTAAERQGHFETARSLWARVVPLLSSTDPRLAHPCIQLARHAMDEGYSARAQQYLLPLLEQPQPPVEAMELLAQTAQQLGDSPTRLRALQGLLDQQEDGPQRHEAELSLARELAEAGREPEGMAHAAAATRGLDQDSPAHADAARVWASLARAADDPNQEADARTALRQALGEALSTKELRAEAMLRAERMSDLEGAQGLIEEGLVHHPHDPLLLSTLKHLTELGVEMTPYLEALEDAVQGMLPGEERDRLLTELALSAADAADAALTYRALDQLSAPPEDPDLILDLRDWAMQSLGLDREQQDQLDARLVAGPVDEGLLRELARSVGEGEPVVTHLVGLARSCEPMAARRLLEATLSQAAQFAPLSLWIEVFGHALRAGAIEAARQAWPALLQRVTDDDDEHAIATLVSLTGDAEQAGLAVSEAIAELLEQALARRPGSHHLHRAIAQHLAQRTQEPTVREAELTAHLDAIADRYELPGTARAELFIGMAERLDRRAAAELLAARAEQALRDPSGFGRLIEALESRHCWPEVLRLLSARVALLTSPQEEVATLKHLAHVAAEVLGDTEAAVEHLEAALALAPTDPDLLLPLLDHHFSRTDLPRAVELTERVLEHVRMGDAAFAVLAHRAADAAIAQGEGERAVGLLERITARIPGDTKARERLAELRRRNDEPAQRVKLLAAVATRQSGAARIEALEERARLLLDPLDRPAEAMEDLAAVVAEAPERQASAELLARLYREHDRFEQLVALYEAELPRRHGEARARVLREIAELHRDELYDLPRAEKALRLAIEQLDASPPQRVLADELREELVANLERQGRFVDLAVYLEQELAAELATGLDVTEAPPLPRLALMQTLARLLRHRLDDEAGAARIYEHLERWDALSDDGLATLARWYRRNQRHGALVRVLQLRARSLSGERRAALDLRIAELLDGPLARPHDAAPHYLEAFLADPQAHAAAGNRARVLLSAVDSVVNVRDRLTSRLDELPQPRRPPLLTLLADVLAPHESHEQEAEHCYREALRLDPELAAAHAGLGRLLSRGGRRAEAAEALVAATEREGLSADRMAETAALAARNLIELERYGDAEAVLRRALVVNPDSTRGLLEMARLYERSGRPGELAQVLDRLTDLPLPGAMRAEVAYRRASLLEPIYEVVPGGPQGERARTLLLEALGINPRHIAARRALLSLATARGEWSTVAHMHTLAIRELPPGVQRAIVHLELAAIYIDHLSDRDSAMRNIESALQQAATDVVVANRTAEVARRLPEPRAAAQRFEEIAAADNELEDATRARLWLLAADLRMEDDDRDAAAAASQRVLDLPSVPEDATAAANRALERLAPHDLQRLADAAAQILTSLETDPPPEPRQRALLLGRLHDIGGALGDAQLVERASREQVELAAVLDGRDSSASTTGALLRDLLAARGEYGPVVELYERLASQAGGDDPVRATAVLVEAAGFAWRGQGEPTHAASLLGRALRLRPDHEAALATLQELIQETSEPEVASEIDRALHEPDPLPPSPKISLLRAMLAITRGAEDEALTLLRPLTGPEIPDAVRLPAMSRLEMLLAERDEHDERRGLLAALLDLARHRRDPRAGDLGLELARLQRAAGDRTEARRSCELARQLAPDHQGLLRMLAELTAADEDWERLVEHYEQLAGLAVDDREQAAWLTRAAQVHLDHPERLVDDDAEGLARRLLLRACEVAPRAAEPRIVMLPLAFRQARWDEVLERAEELVRLVGDDEEVLVLGAIAEAYRRGERRLSREIGYRHSGEVARRLLLPGLQQALGEVALRGPLPRLDALLDAGSALTGGRRHLFELLHAWSGEHPNDAGLSLGLARLYEARGAGDMARHHYQLAAFMAARGPVPALVSRLPPGRLTDPDLHQASTAPMESRSSLRETLTALRDHLAGIGNEGAPQPAPPHAPAPPWWHSRMEQAETIVEPWRAILGVDLPLAWTDAPLPTGVAVRNDRPPRILLGHVCAMLDRPELTFRLATATATVALGTAVLAAGSLDLGVLLDALGQLANPGHQPTGVRSQLMADVLAARDARNIGLTANQRASLADELSHWLRSDDGLVRLDGSLRRSCLLLAARLSGRLDGALLGIARDHGLLRDGRVDAPATLRQEDADWLLRALSLR